MLRHQHIDFDFLPLLGADHRVHSGTCIGHMKQELCSLWEQYGQLPDTYTISNTTIHQLWWTPEQIDYADLGRQLEMEVVTVSTICQPPGNVVPLHRDTFFQISKQFPDHPGIKVRANIHMESYQLGHFIQYVDHGMIKTHVDWQAGDAVIWSGEIEHLGANAGMKDKYTMQVSGFLID